MVSYLNFFLSLLTFGTISKIFVGRTDKPNCKTQLMPQPSKSPFTSEERDLPRRHNY